MLRDGVHIPEASRGTIYHRNGSIQKYLLTANPGHDLRWVGPRVLGSVPKVVHSTRIPWNRDS